MLNELLNLEGRSLFVIDTETTGLNVEKARIIEIAFQQWRAEGLVKEWSSRINPGVPIPPETTKVHGIVDADVAGRPTFKQLAPSLAKGFSNCAYGGKNCRFDLLMIEAEMKRAGQRWSYADAPVIDADRLEQLGEPRRLVDLYRKHTGKNLDDAHQALADVRATTEVLAAQIKRYAVLPRDLGALHELSWPGWLTACGRFRMEDGVARCTFGKRYNGQPMKDIDASFWDWLLTNDFPPDVKRLAADAKIGKYPEKKEQT